MVFAVQAQPPLLSTSAPLASRARVVIVQDDAATESFKPQREKVIHLVSEGIVKFTGKSDASNAWRSLVTPKDVVGIKVYSLPGPQVGTRIPVVEGVVEGLLQAGMAPTNIVVFDRRYSDLRRGGYTELATRYGVRVEGSVEAGWDTNTFYESPLLGQLVYGDEEFQMKSGTNGTIGRKSFVTRLLTRQITKVINLSPLMNHNSAGVCGNLVSLSIGSVDNVLRFEGEPGKLAVAVPEIYALPAVGDRVVLSVVDALVCQYQGEQLGYLHYSAALNQLRFSKDPVALDALSVQELNMQRTRVLESGSWRTNYLDLYRNAELLELGISDPARVDIEKTVVGQQPAPVPAATNSPATANVAVPPPSE